MGGDGKISHEGLKTAALIRSGEGQDKAIERAPGIWECRGIGNIYLVTTLEGDVLVNAGTLGDGKRAKEQFAEISSRPVRRIILTQSHANQYGGLEVFKTSDNQVIAHRFHVEERQRGEMLSAHYRRGSRRIFAGITGPTANIVPTREIMPDLLIGDEGHGFELGGRRFEIVWTPGGETRSAVIVWLPEEKIAIVGNLFGPLFGNHPNLNTMRGDKPRSAAEFITSIRRLRDLGPELILTGHEAISGADHIAQEIDRIADAVEWVHDRTVEGMNAGTPLTELMRDIRTPPELTLTEEYGKLAWNIAAIWHEYTGWFDPARGTTELYTVPVTAIGPALAELAGGAAALVERARRLVDDGLPLEALHMVDMALAADPESVAGRAAKRAALELLLEQTGGQNLWERMWIAAEIGGLGE